MGAPDHYFFGAAARGVKPDKIVTISTWSDENRVLSSKDSAEPGKYRTDRTPFAKQIMDDLSNTSKVERVVMMAGAQVSKTTVGINWIGYVADVAPGPMLVVQPTVDLAKRFSKQRLDPLIEDTECIASKFVGGRRDADNTLLLKQFPGGALILAGANSAAGLRSMPIRYLFCDEIDAYPDDLDDEGSPLALAEKRTTTFSRRKIFLCSTPTIKGFSSIEREYLKGNQCKYYVPCPHCEHKQVLTWEGMRYDPADPSTARYLCADCGVLIEERYKTWMLKHGEWRAHAKGDGKTHSYHISSLYSPIGWKSWSEIVLEFVQCKDDPTAYKTWVNTILGETYDEDQYTEKLDPTGLKARAEAFSISSIPQGALFATMGVDTQDNRLAVSIYTWGEGEESWATYHTEILGDPAMPEVWMQLTELRHMPLTRVDGRFITLEACAIDSGGSHTQQVYDYAREFKGENVLAIKGDGKPGRPAVTRPTFVDFKKGGKVIKKGAEVWVLGVNTVKTTLHARLKKTDPGAAYIHFSNTLEDSYYAQLLVEKQKVRRVNGYAARVWECPPDKRNESWDTAVYAYCALRWMYLRTPAATIWQQFKERIMNQIVERVEVQKEAAPVEKRSPLLGSKVEIPRKKSEFWS